MGKNIQVVRINKSIIDYFYAEMDLGNEHEPYKSIVINEFKKELSKAIKNVQWGDNREIEWV